MKGFIISSLSALVLTAVSTSAVHAQQTAYNPAVSENASSNVARITPVDLVNAAYRGQLENQGIPSYNDFHLAYRARQINAYALVKSAIQSNLLPSLVLNDQSYINAVATQLDVFRYE
ncbi:MULTISPECIES: hypothetical protein [Nostocales]|uniref:DUF4168 domain-containing protein n=2 Tax=Nostocales TaxID=1161 RepID=A0ABW8X045_9CYAN